MQKPRSRLPHRYDKVLPLCNVVPLREVLGRLVDRGLHGSKVTARRVGEGIQCLQVVLDAFDVIDETCDPNAQDTTVDQGHELCVGTVERVRVRADTDGWPRTGNRCLRIQKLGKLVEGLAVDTIMSELVTSTGIQLLSRSEDMFVELDVRLRSQKGKRDRGCCGQMTRGVLFCKVRT